MMMTLLQGIGTLLFLSFAVAYGVNLYLARRDNEHKSV